MEHLDKPEAPQRNFNPVFIEVGRQVLYCALEQYYESVLKVENTWDQAETVLWTESYHKIGCAKEALRRTTKD